jgi:uncharacterized membrane protein YbhN (UPF0104 family)
VFAPPAQAASVADRFVDALGGAHVALLVAAVALHVSAQVCRGLAWHGVLRAPWPVVGRPRACAWHVCGAGLSGVLSGRGGDAVRIALARRDLRDATWPALAGTLAAEGAFETTFGLIVALVAVRLGVGSAVHAPPVELLAALVAGVVVIGVVGARSERVRRLLREVGRGLAVLREPRRWAIRVLPWQLTARLLRIGAAACFLLAFDLPAAPAIVFAACAAQGSGGTVPVPGAGPATIAAALVVALPLAADQPLDPAAVAALAVVWPATLTAAGVALSTVLLAVLCGARSPRGLVRAVRALRARPAPAPAAP